MSTPADAIPDDLETLKAAPLPAHLPRERVVIPAPSVCPCCQGKLVKLGEDVTETLAVIPRQWKVIQTVREKFTCRSCEKITQPPAPFHPIARGRAGAYAGFNALYEPSRKPGPITEAACWAHARRKFFVLADLAKAPLALEAVRRWRSKRCAASTRCSTSSGR